MAETETFLFIYDDGPYPESYEVETDLLKWPLPKIVYAKDYKVGAYKKYWESSGDSEPGESARGAKYKWDADYTDSYLEELK